MFLFLFFQVLNCRKHLNSLSFLTASCSLGPSQPFSFFFCGSSQWGAFGPLVPFPVFLPASLSMLVPTVSTAKCDALIFFWFCFCVEFFPFLLRLCPEKTNFACFLLFLHTFVYITFTSLFSIVCAKTDLFKRVSKKLFQIVVGLIFFSPKIVLFYFEVATFSSIALRVFACALRLSLRGASRRLAALLREG